LCDATAAGAGGLSPPLFEGTWRRHEAPATLRRCTRRRLERDHVGHAVGERRGRALLVAMQSKAMASTTTAPEGRSSMADTARPSA
jgi:hypothetical protein